MISTTVLIILLVALDRASKLWMSAVLASKGTIPLIDGVIGLQLLEGGNTGAAFGLLSGSTLFLIIVTVLVLMLMLYTLYFKKYNSKLLRFCAILITAGGIGNLYDRIAYGYVTDFLKFLFIEFPIFNLADCYVTVGAALALIMIIFSKKDETIFASRDKADGQ